MAGGVSGWYARLDRICPDRIEQITEWLDAWHDSLHTNRPVAACTPSEWPTLPAGLLADPGNVLDQMLARHDADRDGRSPRGAHPTPPRLADAMVASELHGALQEIVEEPVRPAFDPAALPPGFIPHLAELESMIDVEESVEKDHEFEADVLAGRSTRTGVPIPFADLAVGGGLFPARLLRWHADRALRLEPKERADDTRRLISSMQLLDICPVAVEACQRRLLLALVRLDLATLGEAEAGRLGLDECQSILQDAVSVGDALLGDWPWQTAPRLVMGNPPWLRIKDRFRGHENGAALRKRLGQDLRSRKDARGMPRFRTMRGNVNLYRLFVERALRLTEDGGRIRLVVPDSLLREQSSQPLRTLLVEENEWTEAWSFHEAARLFTGVTQGVLILGVTRGGETEALLHRGPAEPFELCDDRGLEPTVPLHVLPREEWARWTGGSWAVPRLPRDRRERERLLRTIEELAGEARISDPDHWLSAGGERVRVRVGEADQTVHSAGMSDWPPSSRGIPFIRGIHFQNDDASVWLRHPGFESSLPVDAAERHHARWTGALPASDEARIVCQAIVNAQQTRRLRFAVIPAGCVLGNSVNHLQLTPEARAELRRFAGGGDGLDWLCDLLNDERLDCWARAWAANNNVNNYELESIPLPMPAPRATSKMHHR